MRDVAWAPNLGMPSNTIASAGQDGKVLIWTQSEPSGPWASKVLSDFKVTVWRVSWSVFGNILAVSDGTNTVTLWKEATDGADCAARSSVDASFSLSLLRFDRLTHVRSLRKTKMRAASEVMLGGDDWLRSSNFFSSSFALRRGMGADPESRCGGLRSEPGA